MNLKYKYLLLLFVIGLSGCTNNKNQKVNLIKSIKILEELKITIFEESIPLKKETKNKIVDIVNSGKLISEEYLNTLHPDFYKNYMDYLNAFKAIALNYDKFHKSITYKKSIQNRILKFWNFVEVNKVEINSNSVTYIFNEKSIWWLFLYMLLSVICSVFVFSIFLFLLMIPVVLIGSIIGVKKTNSKFIIGVSVVPMIIFQIYYWILWSYYCVYTIKWYTDSPDVTYSWIYYIVGVILTLSPLLFLKSKEINTRDSYTDQMNVSKGMAGYILLVFVAFFIFIIWGENFDNVYLTWIVELVFNNGKDMMDLKS